MNQEIKEQFVKKILENHIMWSNSGDNMPSQNCGNIKAEYVNTRREQEIGSYNDFCELGTDKCMELIGVWEDEFTAITYEAASRWQEALMVMGL